MFFSVWLLQERRMEMMEVEIRLTFQRGQHLPKVCTSSVQLIYNWAIIKFLKLTLLSLCRLQVTSCCTNQRWFVFTPRCSERARTPRCWRLLPVPSRTSVPADGRLVPFLNKLTLLLAKKGEKLCVVYLVCYWKSLSVCSSVWSLYQGHRASGEGTPYDGGAAGSWQRPRGSGNVRSLEEPRHRQPQLRTAR